ncbi:hypothetical protein SH203_00031 [Brevundimonas sp. SH203]|uniref:hypothetical protein n=1 Tax=Brevundimonas sp. SH203 TaxID=345167 RepID=UPI0009CADBF1|nr:hypothetical protein [Brevundimonas sp. SH203]GAW39656.1 hypothetical protein SH203_00031 [Brevundimonas sp. SH203]
MILRSGSLFLTLGLSLGGVAAPSIAAAQATPAPVRTTAATVIDSDLLSARRLDFQAADRLYARAVLADDLQAVYARLDALAAQGGAGATRALVLKAVLQWRDGAVEAASDTASSAVERGPDADALMLRGRLLDVQGQSGAAANWYRRARAVSNDAAERALIDQRLAIIGVLGRQPGALTDYARTGDAAAARSAVVLGLLGRPADALALYPDREGKGGANRYGEAIRVADWSIAADRADAPDAAWRAVTAATTAEDRLYALALVVEAFRDRNDLAGAAAYLAAKPNSVETAQTRLDVLLELNRYDEAVGLARTLDSTAAQERLLGVLRAAGRTSDVEAEYARLIKAQPDQPRWSNALAALYLEQGEAERAVGVYRAFFAANRSRPAAQIEAARRMIAMGLGDQARRLLDEASDNAELVAAVRRFEIETAIDQGRNDAAEAGLADLRRVSGRDPVLMMSAAEDYERLGRQDLALATLLDIERAGGALNDEQQSHIAELAFAAGQPQEALRRWRALWAKTELPARKTYLQRLIIRAAQRTGQLDQLGTELEQKIQSGAADQGEVNLLVEIRIEQGDGAGAERAVQTYAERSRAGEVRTLEQLAAVQARLRNTKGLNQTLARLADADPANADGYLRRLVINLLRFPDPDESDAARNARVDALLQRIRAVGRQDDAQAARFAALIYTSAYRLDEALVQYRRALVLAPDDVDALLEYTGALKAQGDYARAAGLLQFKADTATTPAAFVAAVNGLLDLMSASSDADVKPIPADLIQSRLGWARRAAFERILQDGDDVRLSSLVGDIAQDRDDPQTHLRALQASLAVAGDQKPAVLRQLIALTSPGDAGLGDAGLGDARLKAVYGRRLVAMRKPYPPEVYADLAQTFLKQGDAAGAERAFALMGDMGGLVNLDALRGGAYASAGRTAEALASYRLALLQDQDSLDLLTQTAVLMEGAGRNDEASDLYWRAVGLLIQRQPPRLVGDAPPNLDAAQYAPALVEGLILTWPRAETTQRIAQWKTAFAAALASAAPDASSTLLDAPRLALAVAINHRLAVALDDPTLLDMEAPLLQRYGQDAQYLRSLAAVRAGGPDSDPRDWPIADLRRQAKVSGNFNLDLALAFEAEDRTQLKALIAQAIDADKPWREAREAGSYGPQPAMLVSLLMTAADLATPTVIREDLLPALDATPFRDLALFDVYRVDPERFQKLETAAGRRLLADPVLIGLLVTRGNDPLPVAGGAARGRGGVSPLQAMVARFDADGLIGLYEALVERQDQQGEGSALQAPIVGMLLDGDLTPARQARLQTLLLRDIAAERPGLPNSVADFAALLLRLDAPQANRPLLLTAARAAAVRYPDGAMLPKVLEAWFAGDRDGAFEALSGLIEATRAGADSPLQQLAQTRFAAERRRAFDVFLAQPNADREAAARFQRRFLTGALKQPTPDPQMLAAYTRLAAWEPTNVAYVAPLMTLQARAGDFAAAAAAARPYVEAHGDDQEAATALGLALRLSGDEAGATRVAQTASIDLDDADWIGQLATRAATPRSGEGDMLNAFDALWTAYQTRFPQAPAVVALSAPATQATVADGAKPGPLHALNAADRTPAQAAEALRGLWRNTAPRGREDGDAADRQALIDALVDPAATPLLQRPEVIAEIEAELAALSPQSQGRQMRLYDRVARGILAQGDPAGRMAALTARLDGPALRFHDLALYLALADAGERPLSPEAMNGLRRQMQEAAAPSAGLRLVAARVFGRSGDAATAAALVQAALLQTLYPTTDDQSAGDPPLAPGAFVAALAAIPDGRARQSAYGDLKVVFDRQAASPGVARFGDLPPLGASVAR